ncbi:MAG: GspE/PulE family protein [Candidatus Hydrogenedentes bacterium]|nr:GspE/PulE family protein [Candidatus Hydrogenedentota bacterium]
MVRLRVIDEPNHGKVGPVEVWPFASIEERLVNVLASSSESAAVDAVDCALMQAVAHRASDVHFEPWQECLALRYRIDGILHDVAQVPRAQHSRIVARLKILAQLVIYQRDMPQDGRIEPESTPCRKGMRVSTYPTVHGEKVVVRLLDSRDVPFTLDTLGLRPALLGTLRRLLASPQGTILLTGPSSSGKTTTIYAILRELLALREPSPHIATIEDPVEYRLGRVAQTEVNPHAGFTFEAALRSLLRQDPEVIMIGEIRDAETARTAIQAGLTGHLVISTIHSGTAAGVFTRLLDMGIEPFLVASSVTGVLAQRLVRLVCPHCAAQDNPEGSQLAPYGLLVREGEYRQGRGCDACQGIGYRGRTAVGELLHVNGEISDLVLARSRTSVLHEAAIANGMVTLAQDGAARVRAGETTLEELRRVIPPAME